MSHLIKIYAVCEFNYFRLWSLEDKTTSTDSESLPPLPDIRNFTTKYFILSKVYIDEGGMKLLYHGLAVCTEIIHSLKVVDYPGYLLVQADKQ